MYVNVLISPEKQILIIYTGYKRQGPIHANDAHR